VPGSESHVLLDFDLPYGKLGKHGWQSQSRSRDAPERHKKHWTVFLPALGTRFVAPLD
jgi:hypothetical protein